MKKIVTVCLLSLSFGLTLKAQQTSAEAREDLIIGIKAGLNYSNVWDEKGQDFIASPKAGFAGGIFLGIPIGRFLGIQPEILFSQKGLKGSGTLLFFPYSFSRTYSYIDVPLQIQLKPAKFLTIVAGPQYSYLIHQKNEYTLGNNSTDQEIEFKNENIRKNILGFVAGADIIISRIYVSGRVGWDFQNNNGDGSSSVPRYKNQWIQGTIGFRL